MFVTAVRQSSLNSQFPKLRISVSNTSVKDQQPQTSSIRRDDDELVLGDSLRNSSDSRHSPFYDSENVRFEQFVRLLLTQTSLSCADTQTQLIAYVKTLETNYNLTIKNLN